MATLLELVNKNTAGALTQAPAPLGQTGLMNRLLSTKSGKSVADTSAPALSDLGERAAAQQTQNNLIPLQQGAQIQQAQIAQQSAGIEQGRQQTRADQELSRKGISLQGQIHTGQLLQDIEQQRGNLDLQRDGAKLEQLAFGLRMQDTEYLDDLAREGAKQRLDDQSGFQDALQKSIFGDQTDLLETALGGKSVLETSDRDFNQWLSSMSVDQAIQLASIDIRGAQNKAEWERKNQGQAIEIAAKEGQQKGMWNAIGGLPSPLAGLAGNLGGKTSSGSLVKSSSGSSTDTSGASSVSNIA